MKRVNEHVSRGFGLSFLYSRTEYRFVWVVLFSHIYYDYIGLKLMNGELGTIFFIVHMGVHHHVYTDYINKKTAGRVRKNKGEFMKVHVEYDDFGEYVEAYDGENLYVVEEHTIGKTVELILFKEAG